MRILVVAARPLVSLSHFLLLMRNFFSSKRAAWLRRPFYFGKKINAEARRRRDRSLIFVLLLFFVSACQKQEPLVFRDVAEEVGLDFKQGTFNWGMSGDPVAMMGGGLCWLDFDNDGWLDLYVVNSYSENEAGLWDVEVGKRPINRLFKNNQGQFVDVSESSGTGINMRGMGCVAADFDNNGFADIYITTSRLNVLFWNNGDGTFTEGAKLAEVNAYGWQSAVSVGDINQDGWLDMFVAGYVNMIRPITSATMGFPNTHEGMPDLLYLNNGDRTFREVGQDVGLETADFAYGLGSALLDYDQDGDLDLFVANDTNPNMLYEFIRDDDRELGFYYRAVGDSAKVDDINSGMGVASADFDGSGTADIFVTNMGRQTHSLYTHHMELTFTDALAQVQQPELGVGYTGWGAGWQDFDNDSDLDLFIANGAIPVIDLDADKMAQQLFENGNGMLQDVSERVGLLEIGQRIGRGMASADFDNDGDIDIAINSIADDLILLRNESAGNNWLMVALKGNVAGVTVTVTLEDGRTLTRFPVIGSSYLASEDPRVHFGLGEESAVSKLEIKWPNGETQSFNDVNANQIFTTVGAR